MLTWMIAKMVTVNLYLYNLGASEKDERPPKIHTLPTTNQTAKKQSSAILKWSTNAWILPFLDCNFWILEQIAKIVIIQCLRTFTNSDHFWIVYSVNFFYRISLFGLAISAPVYTFRPSTPGVAGLTIKVAFWNSFKQVVIAKCN